MYLICPQCNRQFFFEFYYLGILAESFGRNPKLQIICSFCGRLAEKKSELLRASCARHGEGESGLLRVKHAHCDNKSQSSTAGQSRPAMT